MEEKGGSQLNMGEYLKSSHFMEATFENWESEFLQMALFVFLTIFLFQKGSSESKDPSKSTEEVNREPNPRKKNAPWPVKYGGIILTIYKHSLSLVLAFIFLMSFWVHWISSMRNHNQEQALMGKPAETALQYLGNSKLWFESFQNWQSEFLSIFAIVVLSIFLREKGSPQSKPVDAPHSQTGE